MHKRGQVRLGLVILCAVAVVALVGLIFVLKSPLSTKGVVIMQARAGRAYEPYPSPTPTTTTTQSPTPTTTTVVPTTTTTTQAPTPITISSYTPPTAGPTCSDTESTVPCFCTMKRHLKGKCANPIKGEGIANWFYPSTNIAGGRVEGYAFTVLEANFWYCIWNRNTVSFEAIVPGDLCNLSKGELNDVCNIAAQTVPECTKPPDEASIRAKLDDCKKVAKISCQGVFMKGKYEGEVVGWYPSYQK